MWKTAEPGAECNAIETEHSQRPVEIEHGRSVSVSVDSQIDSEEASTSWRNVEAFHEWYITRVQLP